MAKEQPSGRGKVRIVVIEMEGGDKTIADGLATLAAALTRPTQPGIHVVKAPNTVGPDALGEAHFAEGEPEEMSQTPAVQVPTARKDRKVVTPEVVELDLRSHSPSWKEFAEQKSPANGWERYLVCMVWLKTALKKDVIDMHHIFTLYKAAGWSTKMSDFGQTFRALRRAKLIERVQDGQYKLNHLGEDRVDQMGGK